MTVCVPGAGGGSVWGGCLPKARFRVLAADVLAARQKRAKFSPRAEAGGPHGTLESPWIGPPNTCSPNRWAAEGFEAVGLRGANP